MEFFRYYGRHKRKNRLVLQTSVIQKGKTFQFRANQELGTKIEDLAKELNQSDSKVIKDILEDFFLDRERIAWQKEVEEFTK